ncbi:MAG: hypothetical protein ACHQT8_00610 [Chlamydiales bacterium]
MLKFFRKYQRFFFVITTVVIVISFSFFGTFSTFLTQGEVADEVIGKAIDGSTLHKREVEELSRFLSTSMQDAHLLNQGKVANLFNDDVVKKDFLQTGMGSILAERFFEELRPQLEEKREKIKRFVPYTHPSVPFLSTDMLLEQFSPHTFQLMGYLKKKESVDTQFFALLTALSTEQPNPEMLRRILFMQESQYPGIRRDDNLYSANLHPFGFETWEEWFGPRYLELVSQFILNSAKLAEKKGYSVSLEEVRADLSRHLQDGLKILRPQTDLSYDNVRDYFIHQLRMLGMEENRVVKLWQKVMLFRRLFSEVGNFALLDPLTFETWGSYANETVEIEQYALPDELRLKDFRSLLLLQIYLEGAAGSSQSELLLPEQLLPVQEVEKRQPELVQRTATLEWKQVNKEALSQRVTLKETWQWEAADAGWEILQEKFSRVAKEKNKTKDERLAFLDTLDPQERLKIDRCARLHILEAHPEWIEEAFAQQEPEQRTLAVHFKGGSLPFFCPLDGVTLLENLEKKGDLSFISEEGVIARVRAINVSPHVGIVSFSAALHERLLDPVLDKRLEEAYPEMRKKNSALFTQENGKWKSFQEVKDHVGAYLYAPLMNAIEENWIKESSALASKADLQSLDFYTTRRLYAWMKNELVQQQKTEDRERVWKVEKEIRTVARGGKSLFPKEELFSLAEGNWSSVAVGDHGEIAFCRLVKKGGEKSQDSQELAQAKTMLSREACRKLAEDLLSQMVQKRAIGMHLTPKETVR